VTRLFYFGESVLLPEYRGHGIGHAFFDPRERPPARGASAACFAAVMRAPDHPARPAGYRPLDAFWHKGYALSRAWSPICRGKSMARRRKAPRPCNTGSGISNDPLYRRCGAISDRSSAAGTPMSPS
jgi:GNAT superfamily N-acetyltransferase